MADAIGIKIIVDAARALAELKKTEDNAKAATDAFNKLSDAEKKAITEMAQLQAAARALAAEEARLSAYTAEAAKLRKEETESFQKAAKEAAAETNRLTQESARLARESTALANAIESARKETSSLAKANDDHAEAMDRSRSKLSLLTTSVGDIGQKLQDISPLWGSIAVNAVGAFARISIGVGVAVAGISALTMGLGRLAADSERTERAERILGASMDAVRATTLDTVTAQQALALQQGLVQSGLRVSAEQLGVIAGKAREFALATGGETPEALNQMLDALRGLEAEGLRRFGVTLNATGDRQRDFNTAVEALTNRERLAAEQAHKWGNSLEAVANQQQRVSTSARTMGEDADRASTSFSRMTSNIAASFARAMDLNGVFQFWAETFDPTTNQRRIASNSARMRADERSRERSNTMGALGRLRSAGYNVSTLTQYAQSEGADLGELARIRGAAGVAGDLAERGAGGAQVAAAMRGLGALPGVQSMLRTQTREDSSREMAVDSERKLRKLGDAAEGAARGLNAVQRATARSLAGRAGITAPNADEFSDMLGQLAAPTGEEITAQDNERGKAEAAFAEERAGVRRDAQLRTRRTNRDRETRTQALRQDRSVGGGLLRGLGVNGDVLETEAKLSQGYADTIVGAYSKIGDAITKHIELVASGQETIGQAMLNGVHEVTKALAMEAFPKALMETAAGLAALANPITAPTAPLHFTAAAVYGSVTAGAGLVAGVTGALGAGQSAGAGAGARATGSARAASGASSSGSQENAPPVNIYLSSIVPPGPRELQSLVAAGAQAGRYNLDRRRDMIPRQVRA